MIMHDTITYIIAMIFTYSPMIKLTKRTIVLNLESYTRAINSLVYTVSLVISCEQPSLAPA